MQILNHLPGRVQWNTVNVLIMHIDIRIYYITTYFFNALLTLFSFCNSTLYYLFDCIVCVHVTMCTFISSLIFCDNRICVARGNAQIIASKNHSFIDVDCHCVEWNIQCAWYRYNCLNYWVLRNFVYMTWITTD